MLGEAVGDLDHVVVPLAVLDRVGLIPLPFSFPAPRALLVNQTDLIKIFAVLRHQHQVLLVDQIAHVRPVQHHAQLLQNADQIVQMHRLVVKNLVQVFRQILLQFDYLRHISVVPIVEYSVTMRKRIFTLYFQISDQFLLLFQNTLQTRKRAVLERRKVVLGDYHICDFLQSLAEYLIIAKDCLY